MKNNFLFPCFLALYCFIVFNNCALFRPVKPATPEELKAIMPLLGKKVSITNASSGKKLSVAQGNLGLGGDFYEFTFWDLGEGGYSFVNFSNFLYAEGNQPTLGPYANQSNYRLDFYTILLSENIQISTIVDGKRLYLTEVDGTVKFAPNQGVEGKVQLWNISKYVPPQFNEPDNIISEPDPPYPFKDAFGVSELKPLLQSLMDKGLLTKGLNVILDKEQDVFANCPDTLDCYMNADQQKVYKLFKAMFKQKNSITFENLWFSLGNTLSDEVGEVFKQMSDSLALDRDLIIEDIIIKKEERAIAYANHIEIVEKKIKDLIRLRNRVSTVFEEYDKIFLQWYNNAANDIDDLKLNMSLVNANPSLGSPFKVQTVVSTILDHVEIPGPSYVFSNKIIQFAYNSLTDELFAPDPPSELFAHNKFSEAVNNLENYYEDVQLNCQKALTSYMILALTNPSILQDAAFNATTSNVAIGFKGEVISQLREETQKDIFRQLLPTKGVTYTWKKQDWQQYVDDNRYPQFKWPDNEFDLNYHMVNGSLMKSDQLSTLREFFEETLNLGVRPYEKWVEQIKVLTTSGSSEGLDDDDFADLGNSGKMSITKLRSYFTPAEIIAMFPPENQFAPDGFGGISPRSKAGTSAAYYDYIWESEVSPSSFYLGENEVFIDVTVKNIFFVDAGNDDHGDIEVRGEVEIIAFGDYLEPVKGYSGKLEPPNSFPLFQTLDLKLKNGSSHEPANPVHYRIKITDQNKSDLVFVIAPYFSELDYGITSDDLFGFDINELTISWKDVISEKNNQSITKSLYLEVPGDKAKIGIDLAFTTISKPYNNQPKPVISIPAVMPISADVVYAGLPSTLWVYVSEKYLVGQEESVQFCITKPKDEYWLRAVKLFNTFGKEILLELHGENNSGPICTAILPLSDFEGTVKAEFWWIRESNLFKTWEKRTTKYFRTTPFRGKKVTFNFLDGPE